MLLLLLPDFSVEEVEEVLEAGDDKFWETVDEDALFPGGDVFTDRGEVNPEFLDAEDAEEFVAFDVKGGVLLGGAVVLKS